MNATAAKDPICHPNEIIQDATKVVVEERLEWALIEDAHDIPATESGKIVDAIWAC